MLFLCATSLQTPDKMLDKGGTEFVLGTYPQLASFILYLIDDSQRVTTLALALPSLQTIDIRYGSVLESSISIARNWWMYAFHTLGD